MIEALFAVIGLGVVGYVAYKKGYLDKLIAKFKKKAPATPVAPPVSSPAPVAPALVETVPAPSTAEVNSVSTYTDPFPNDSINSLLGKIKAVHDKIVALGKPGSNGKDPPVSTDGKAVDAGPYWGERNAQAGMCHSLTHKQEAQKLATNTAEEIVSAAESGDYSKIHGA